MPEDFVAYLLLVLPLLVVALVLTLPLLALLWLVGKPRDSRRHRAPRSHGTRSRPAAPEVAARADPDGRVLRRCDACGTGWKDVPGHDIARTSLRVRRWARRRARRRGAEAPDWARRQGWSRCPSCLSTRVRTSSRQGTGHAVDSR